MVKKHETWSNVTSSNPTCPPPRLFHHHRFKDGISIVSPIVHPPIIESPKRKGKRKTVPRCAYILAKIMVSKRGPKEPGGTRWKNRSSAFAVRPRRWQHLTKRSRVADGGTRIDGRVFVVFPFLFFFPLWSYLSLPRAPATLFDRLSLARQGVPLFSRSWQIRLMRWTRWDMGQRIGVQCRHGRGVTVPWKRPCPGPQSRRELSAGWSPV